jgi:hypothetical protein
MVTSLQIFLVPDREVLGVGARMRRFDGGLQYEHMVVLWRQ